MHCLNLCLAYILTPMVKQWRARGLDFRLKHDEEHEGDVSHPFHNWADDIFLFSGRVEHMQVMLDEITEVLKRKGGR